MRRQQVVARGPAFRPFVILLVGITILCRTSEAGSGVPFGRKYLDGGSDHYCVLRGGRISCWGKNTVGQLGLDSASVAGKGTGGFPQLSLAPLIQFKNTDVAISLGLGYFHTCAVFASGGVRCWGRNTSGQLGLGHSSSVGTSAGDMSALPYITFSSTHPATQVTAGEFHTCALFNNGKVRCWGSDSRGQLPNYSSGQGNAPGEMESLTFISQFNLDAETVQLLDSGEDFTCVLNTLGQVRCFGARVTGGIGQSTTYNYPWPSATTPALTVTHMSCQGTGICAVFSNNKTRCIGESTYDAGNDPSTAEYINIAGSSDGDVRRVWRGMDAMCFQYTNDDVRCYGKGGEAFRTSNTGVASSTTIAPLNTAPAVVIDLAIPPGASESACVMLGTYEVRCSGDNTDGRLGVDSSTATIYPGGQGDMTSVSAVLLNPQALVYSLITSTPSRVDIMKEEFNVTVEVAGTLLYDYDLALVLTPICNPSVNHTYPLAPPDALSGAIPSVLVNASSLFTLTNGSSALCPTTRDNLVNVTVVATAGSNQNGAIGTTAIGSPSVPFTLDYGGSSTFMPVLGFYHHDATKVNTDTARPRSGPVGGNTVVVVDVQSFIESLTVYPSAYSLDQSNLRCRFDDVIVQAETSSNLTTMLCTSPGRVNASSVPLSISLNGHHYYSVGTFQYYTHGATSPTLDVVLGIVEGNTKIVLAEGTVVPTPDLATVKFVSPATDVFIVTGVVASGGGNITFASPSIASVAASLSPPVTFTVFYSLNGGQQYTPHGVSFEYYTSPSIASITPAGVPVSETHSLVISLQGNAMISRPATTRVRFVDISSGNITYASTTFVAATSSIRCQSPLSSTVTSYQVEVSLNNQQYTANGLALEYYATVSIQPRAGLISGGTLVSIHGAGFFAPSGGLCRFFSDSVDKFTSAKFSSPTLVVCTSPAVSVGSILHLQLSLDGSNYHNVSHPFLTYVHPPVTGLSSELGPAVGANKSVTVTLALPVPVSLLSPVCRFGQVASVATINPALSNTTMTCVAPDGIGQEPLSLALNAQDVVSSPYTYTYFTVNSVDPPLGPEGGGSKVTIAGSGFSVSGQWTCRFGSSAVVATRVSNVVLECISPVHAGLPVGAQSANVQLTVSGDGIYYAPGVTYTYHRQVVISSVSPVSGAARGGTSVTITGSGIYKHGANPVTCSFSGQVVTATIPSGSADVCVCTSPPGSGYVQVRVALNNNDYSAVLSGSSANGFTYVSVTAIEPIYGSTIGGTQVSVRGAGFSQAIASQLQCSFGGAVVPARYVDSVSVLCTSPPRGNSGGVSIELSSNLGLDYSNTGTVYHYQADPSIVALSPKSGPVFGGGLIKVTAGTPSFAGLPAMTCKLGAILSTAVRNSDSELACPLPAGSGERILSLSYNGLDYITVGVFSYFHVRSITPSSGPRSGTTVITVVGTGFSADTAYQCVIDGVRVSARRVDTSTLTCQRAPQASWQAMLESDKNDMEIASMMSPLSRVIPVDDHRDGYHRTQAGWSQINVDVVVAGEDVSPLAAASNGTKVFRQYTPPRTSLVAPLQGPTRGNTSITLTLHATTPVQSSRAWCLFSANENVVDPINIVEATTVNSTHVTCLTSAHVLGNVTVSVSLNGQDFHSTDHTFEFEECAGGYFARTFEDICAPCPKGMFVNKTGQKECEPCGLASYADVLGSRLCKPCPLNTRISGPPVSLLACQCEPGFYAPPSSSSDGYIGGVACIPCPAGGNCPGLLKPPVAQPGFWQSPSSFDVFVACAHGPSCPGQDKATCDRGYRGYACADCEPGYYKSGFTCVSCPSSFPWPFFVFLVVVLIVCCILLKTVDADDATEYGAILGVVTEFLQILSLVGRMQLQWPGIVESLIRLITALFSLNMDILAPECSLEVGFTFKYVATLMVPLVFLIMFALVYAVVRLHLIVVRLRNWPPPMSTDEFDSLGKWDRFVQTMKTPVNLSRLTDRITNSFMLLVALAYLFLVETAISFFACSQQLDGQPTLNVNPSLLCYAKWWMELLPVAVFFTSLYLVCLPVGLVWWLYRNRSHLREPLFAARFGSMYQVYKPQYYYWESIAMAHKALLSVLFLFLFEYMQFQIVCVLLLLFGCLSFYEQTYPFMRPQDNHLDSILRWCSCLVLLGGLLFHVDAFPTPAVKGFVSYMVILIILFACIIIGVSCSRELWRTHQGTRHKLPRDLLRLMSSHLTSSGTMIVTEWLRHGRDAVRNKDRFRLVLSALNDYARSRTGTQDKDNDQLESIYPVQGVYGVPAPNDTAGRRPSTIHELREHQAQVAASVNKDQLLLVSSFASHIFSLDSTATLLAWIEAGATRLQYLSLFHCLTEIQLYHNTGARVGKTGPKDRGEANSLLMALNARSQHDDVDEEMGTRLKALGQDLQSDKTYDMYNHLYLRLLEQGLEAGGDRKAQEQVYRVLNRAVSLILSRDRPDVERPTPSSPPDPNGKDEDDTEARQGATGTYALNALNLLPTDDPSEADPAVFAMFSDILSQQQRAEVENTMETIHLDGSEDEDHASSVDPSVMERRKGSQRLYLAPDISTHSLVGLLNSPSSRSVSPLGSPVGSPRLLVPPSPYRLHNRLHTSNELDLDDRRSRGSGSSRGSRGSLDGRKSRERIRLSRRSHENLRPVRLTRSSDNIRMDPPALRPIAVSERAMSEKGDKGSSDDKVPVMTEALAIERALSTQVLSIRIADSDDESIKAVESVIQDESDDANFPAYVKTGKQKSARRGSKDGSCAMM